jgi:hypothetical protein
VVASSSTRPGLGKGDQNHVHTGPPGQNASKRVPAVQPPPAPPATPATQDNGTVKENRGNGDPGGGRDKNGK